jgi:hypothetical protein
MTVEGMRRPRAMHRSKEKSLTRLADIITADSRSFGFTIKPGERRLRKQGVTSDGLRPASSDEVGDRTGKIPDGLELPVNPERVQVGRLNTGH